MATYTFCTIDLSKLGKPGSHNHTEKDQAQIIVALKGHVDGGINEIIERTHFDNANNNKVGSCLMTTVLALILRTF